NDGAEKLWGSGSVCRYVRCVYETRNHTLEEMVSPTHRLRAVAGGLVDQLSPWVISRSIEILEPSKVRTLGELLAGLTNDDLWISKASGTHAARYLTSEISDDLVPL